MTWLAWRQQRFPVIATTILIAVYASLALAARYDTEFVTITQLFAGYLTIGVCLFWGVPLVARDIEHGTHRLAWTQSMSRRRWLGARITVAAGGALTAAAALTAIITWLLPASGVDPTTWYYYESHDLVPFARVLFALALGTALGALTRHIHIAMAISVPLLGIVQLGGARGLREATTLSYWELQLAESGAYLALAAALVITTFVAVARQR